MVVVAVALLSAAAAVPDCPGGIKKVGKRGVKGRRGKVRY
jgi:hypothetical protein